MAAWHTEGRTPDAHTTLVGVIGHPVRHSLSPLLHNTAFVEMGLDWVSVGFPVAAGQVEGALSGMRALGIAGLSVTMPHKDEVAVLARDFDAMADQLRANRSATTQLLRDISHELRSPLARMRVALGLARQPPADLVRQLDRLEREIERLDSMISQVLKLARLHGAEARIEKESFELDEVIEEVVRDANLDRKSVV